MFEAISALVGALVGGVLATLGTWILGRRQVRREASAYLYREVIPFLSRELQIGPRTLPGRTVELVGQEFAVHGEHPREAFTHAVDSLERWSVLTSRGLAERSGVFVRQIAERRGFIEGYDGASPVDPPDQTIVDDPQYVSLTAAAIVTLHEIDALARVRARRT